MIVSQRAKIACNIHRYLSRAARKSLLSHFSFAFSDIEQKADLFMCAATTILTLTKSKPNSLLDASKDKRDSQIVKTWLKNNQPFSLREKVVHYVSQLQLYKPQNKQEILKLFQQNHGLGLNNLQIQSRIEDGAWFKMINDQVQKYFVFNPTSVFKELLELFESDWPQRKIVMGFYGIGKSSNQLLANILTIYLFEFRKEGKKAHKDLQEIIHKNLNLLTQIVGFTEADLQVFEDKNQLVKYFKRQFFKIPFILYYSLPLFQKNKTINQVGFTQKDFVKYLSDKEIQKLPRKQSRQFCQYIARTCRENNIRISLVIDQSNFFFSTLRQLLFLQQKSKILEQKKALKSTLDEFQKQTSLLRNNAQKYGAFLDSVASIFSRDPNITLSCSENAQYPLYPPRNFMLYNPYTRYTNIFFNKQYSKQGFQVEYGRNRWNRDWQRDMNLVFWFQLESVLLNQIFKQARSKKQLQDSAKVGALNNLKYYYFYLVFYGELSTQYFWSDAARHMHMHQSFRRTVKLKVQPQKVQSRKLQPQEVQSQKVQSKEDQSKKVFQKRNQIKQIEQIIARLIEQKQNMRIQYIQNKVVLDQFAQNIRNLRQTVRQQCQQNHLLQLSSFLTKNHTNKIKYLRFKFIIELHSIVNNLQKSQNQQVVIDNQQIQQILKQMDDDTAHITLEEVINKSYMTLKVKNKQKTLIFNRPLEQLKKYLDDQVTKINYELFIAFLLLESSQYQRYNVEKLLKIFLTTQKHEINIKGNVQETFNIMNQSTLRFISFKSLLTRQKNKEAQFLKVIEQTNQKQVKKKYGKDGLWFWGQYQKQKEKQMKSSEDSQEIKIKTSEDSQEIKIKLFQNVFRKWLIKYSDQLKDEQKGRTVETAWSHIFQLLNKQENKGIQNLTYGASPNTLESESKIQDKKEDAPNNPYFDLVLIKKNQQKENTKPFKVIAIEVTVGKSNVNYTDKLLKFIQFKKYFFLNHLEYFKDKELEIWILCPQQLAKTNSQRWLEKFKENQENLDKKIKSKSDPIVLRIVSVQDIKVKGKNQTLGNFRLNLISHFIKMMKK